MTCCSGCATRLAVIPADKEAKFLRAGQTFTATNDVWLVPPALWLEMNEQLSDYLRSRPATPHFEGIQ